MHIIVTDDLTDITHRQWVRNWWKVDSEDTVVRNGVGVGNNCIDCVTGLRVNSQVATKRARNSSIRPVILELDIQRPMVVVTVIWMTDRLD